MIRHAIRKLRLAKRKAALANGGVTVIAKDCTGAMLLHDLGLRFDTPTVNLFFTAGDFVKLSSRLEHYIGAELGEDTTANEPFPVGLLDDVRVYFRHYKTFATARQKWLERCKRIHWDNLRFLMTDGCGSSEALVHEFDALPLKHKVLLTCRDYRDVQCAVKMNIPGRDGKDLGAPELFRYKGLFLADKVIDDLDYISFLNGTCNMSARTPRWLARNKREGKD